MNTFGGNPAACALALRNLEILEQEKLVERADILGKKLTSEFTALLDHQLVGDIRSFGLVIGIELVADKATKQPADLAVVKGIIAGCKAKGLIIGKNGDTVAGFNNVLTIAPPLSSTDEDIQFIIDTVKAVLNGSSAE
ncbi:Taurine--pyruvate aminotransferase [compost metagenome]